MNRILGFTASAILLLTMQVAVTETATWTETAINPKLPADFRKK
jgi:hypothetical protein